MKSNSVYLNSSSKLLFFINFPGYKFWMRSYCLGEFWIIHLSFALWFWINLKCKMKCCRISLLLASLPQHDPEEIKCFAEYVLLLQLYKKFCHDTFNSHLVVKIHIIAMYHEMQQETSGKPKLLTRNFFMLTPKILVHLCNILHCSFLVVFNFKPFYLVSI